MGWRSSGLEINVDSVICSGLKEGSILSSEPKSKLAFTRSGMWRLFYMPLILTVLIFLWFSVGVGSVLLACPVDTGAT